MKRVKIEHSRQVGLIMTSSISLRIYSNRIIQSKHQIRRLGIHDLNINKVTMDNLKLHLPASFLQTVCSCSDFSDLCVKFNFYCDDQCFQHTEKNYLLIQNKRKHMYKHNSVQVYKKGPADRSYKIFSYLNLFFELKVRRYVTQ